MAQCHTNFGIQAFDFFNTLIYKWKQPMWQDKLEAEYFLRFSHRWISNFSCGFSCFIHWQNSNFSCSFSVSDMTLFLWHVKYLNELHFTLNSLPRYMKFDSVCSSFQLICQAFRHLSKDRLCDWKKKRKGGGGSTTYL